MPRKLAILIDPDKRVATASALIGEMSVAPPDYVFVGGSSGASADSFITALKERVNARVVLFPGNFSQISERADALLFLSLLSGRNPEWLIGQQVAAAARLRGSRLEIVPTGYLLVDGGRRSAVERVSATVPIARTDLDMAVNTAFAAQLLGMRAVYLEAGSGAARAVPENMIRAVRSAVSCVLLVGGGIRTPEMADTAWSAGADVVVVGNALERDPGLYRRLLAAR